ncbi:MAG: trypsin-like peptidase domain-containing protein [Flavobacteriales bacterium]|nr:trypsin-like peptidase domain-containing protein [Flavobacteriales bacterium]
MKNGIKFFAFTIAVAIASGLSALIVYKVIEKPTIVTVSESPLPANHLTSNKMDMTNRTSLELAAQLSVNSVVHVKTEVMVNRPVDPFHQFFYGDRYQQQQQLVQSSGSGVIISDNGYIVTNNHVIENAENIHVTLNNKKTYDAEVVGTDPNTDLALLKIDDEHLPYIKFGNSDDVNIGQWVLAVGNPYNLTSTVTAGIVSAKGRDINILKNDPYSGTAAVESFIQTDAAVNPGNSGGALVASTGELIGINSAIQSNTGSYTGYSFAIPVNIVKKVVSDLKEFGTVQRAFIGVSISNISDELARQIGTDDLNGVYINGTTEKGSAAKAGIKAGDIIKKIGNKDIHDVAELQEQISQFRPGDKVNIMVQREDEELDVAVTLKNMEGNEELVAKESNQILKQLGAKFTEPSKIELKKLKVNNGVKVEELYNGKLQRVGVREGFIITKINQHPIEDVDDLIKTIESSKGGILIEGLYENGRREFYGFGV